MRFFQLTSKARLVVGDRSECEEAIHKVTGQNGTVLQVLHRLSLGVQQALDSLDDFFAMSQEQSHKLDMLLKRHRAKTSACHNAPPRRIVSRLPSGAPYGDSHCVVAGTISGAV